MHKHGVFGVSRLFPLNLGVRRRLGHPIFTRQKLGHPTFTRLKLGHPTFTRLSPDKNSGTRFSPDKKSGTRISPDKKLGHPTFTRVLKYRVNVGHPVQIPHSCAAARGWPAQATRTSEGILVVKRNQKSPQNSLFDILKILVVKRDQKISKLTFLRF